MKTRTRRIQTDRGSALLAAMIVVMILSVAGLAILDYSLSTYRLSKRQALMDQVKETADSEMEFLYYKWKATLLAKISVGSVATNLSHNGYTSTDDVSLANASSPSTVTLFSPPPTILLSSTGWSVYRSLHFSQVAGSADGGARGLLPDLLQVGKNYFYDAETSVSATPSSGGLGKLTFHSGRHFVYSSTSLFQYAVFYQGNLEIAAGSNMTITGPLSTNASAYLGSQTNYSLTLTDKAYYFQDYNGASDPLSGESDRLQGTGALNDPIYNPDPTGTEPNQTSQRAVQVQQLVSQSSFVGGIDVAAAIANYPNAYVDPSGSTDPNEVYRAVIAPPPPVPEDPNVAASRMYNGAGIVITINQSSPGTASTSNTTVEIGTPDDPNYYVDNNIITPAQRDLIVPPSTTAVSGTVNGNTIGGGTLGYRTPMTDKREEANGTSTVYTTTVDVGQLNAALYTDIPSNPTTLGTNYNGLVYVYDNSNMTSTGTNPLSEPGALSAILLYDGQTTPAYNDASGNPLGFSVASNNGIYVQGDYNVTQITTSDGTVQNNPAAIMGDAVTALSVAYTAANSSAPIDGSGAVNRIAQPSDTVTLPAIPGNGSVTGSAYGLSNPSNQANTTGMTVNAAILTGNTPSNSTSTTQFPSGYNSGGVQNLVRMEEDWWGGGLTLTLDGSLGQLFTSDYFKGPYVGNAYQASIGDRVYIQPLNRNMQFDSNFQNHSPSGTPTTTSFSRGDFFSW